MDIGQKIRQERRAKKKTQVEIASKAKIAVNSLRLYEAGERSPTFETIQSIAEALDIPVNRLLGRGMKVMDKVSPFVSDKSGRLNINIDSGLLASLNAIAEEDELSLEDEVENMLKDHVDLLIDEDQSQNSMWQQ